MGDLAKLFADFTPGAYGIWSGVLLYLAYMAREWRETRKLSADDRLARREGYAKQVENLTAECRRLRGDLAQAETTHNNYRHACQLETDQLRTEIRQLEDMVSGLRRQHEAQASAAGRAILGGFDAPVATARAQRLLNDDPA